VPLGLDEERSLPAERPAAARLHSREPTEPIALIDGQVRGARPLPGRADFDDSATGTASVPRITRIQLSTAPSAPSAPSATGDDEVALDEPTFPPPPPPSVAAVRPLPPAAGAPTAGAPTTLGAQERTSPDRAAVERMALPITDRIPLGNGGGDSEASTTGELDVVAGRRAASSVEALHDGTLVVEAPADATVIVNGIERGRGLVRVADLDRSARHAVRILCPGHQTWSGSVSLDGKPAAKIRPTLKPRVR
jgi:hypothetical protein